MLAVSGPVAVYAVILGLHLLLPGRWIDGYVLDGKTGKALRYRLNGLRVLSVVVALSAALSLLGVILGLEAQRRAEKVAMASLAAGAAKFTAGLSGSS